MFESSGTPTVMFPLCVVKTYRPLSLTDPSYTMWPLTVVAWTLDAVIFVSEMCPLVVSAVMSPDDPVTLQLPDRTITFPATTLDAVQSLCNGTDHKVGELPGLAEQDQLVLVRRLLTEAVLVATSA